MLWHFLKQLWKGKENASGSWPVACFVIYILDKIWIRDLALVQFLCLIQLKPINDRLFYIVVCLMLSVNKETWEMVVLASVWDLFCHCCTNSCIDFWKKSTVQLSSELFLVVNCALHNGLVMCDNIYLKGFFFFIVLVFLIYIPWVTGLLDTHRELLIRNTLKMGHKCKNLVSVKWPVKSHRHSGNI